jgi:hypothetical protein
MTVIAFEANFPRRDGFWRTRELNQLAGRFAATVAGGEAGGWEVAATEIGDPQFYLLGPPPDEDCMLCISRLGRVYLLEDGSGRFLSQRASLERLFVDAIAFLKDKRTRLVARAMLLWCALRHAFEERVEPLLIEGEEMLTHFAPQFGALA